MQARMSKTMTAGGETVAIIRICLGQGVPVEIPVLEVLVVLVVQVARAVRECAFLQQYHIQGMIQLAAIFRDLLGEAQVIQAPTKETSTIHKLGNGCIPISRMQARLVPIGTMDAMEVLMFTECFAMEQ